MRDGVPFSQPRCVTPYGKWHVARVNCTMTTAEAIAVMDALARGVHPNSKEMLQSPSVVREPIVVRALLHAIEVMKSGAGIEFPESPAGNPSPQDDLEPAKKPTAELLMELVRRVLSSQPKLPSRTRSVVRNRPVMETSHPPAEFSGNERSGRNLVGMWRPFKRLTAEDVASTDSCPKHCRNCESPLASWGEYISDGKCVWCENSGRVW